MLRRDAILSHLEMCAAEGGMMLQKGMNFRPRGRRSILLMSLRPNAPYPDLIEDEGRTLIYEGHNIGQVPGGPDPNTVDQPMTRPNGAPSDNAKFLNSALAAKAGEPGEVVHVYEKIRTNTWSFAGAFRLVDAWPESRGGRKVFKFKLSLIEEVGTPEQIRVAASRGRVIPSSVRVEVWRRDAGKCRQCGSDKDLHFDHIIPFSKGGSSVLVENVQILCSRHNLAKSDRIQ